MLLFVALTLMACGAFVAACDTASGDHQHVFGSWTVSKAATCEEEGTERRDCLECDYFEERPYDALGHDWSVRVNVEATCTEPGKKGSKCGRCGTEEVTVIPQLEHDWEVTSRTDPTCTEDGIEELNCKLCGADNSNVLKALGHDWDEEHAVIVVPVSCEKDGRRDMKCKRCSAPATGEERVIKHVGHIYDVISAEPATCEEDGMEHLMCRTCGDTKDEKIPALKHTLGGTGVVVQEATCTKEGILEGECLRCHHTVQTSIPAAGHTWSTEYTIDVEPTFQAGGSKSIHCLICGDQKPDSSVSIDRLEQGKQIEYEFRIVRNNGDTLVLPGISFVVKNASGDTVLEGTDARIIKGSLKAKLLPETYTVTVTSQPEGYTAESSYTVTAGNPLCKINLTGSLISEPATASTRYAIGSVMHDFTITSIDGKSYTLSALLKEKKFVMINFFFIGCGPCRSEIPGMDGAYLIYRDDMELLSISISPDDTHDDLMNFADDFDLPIDYPIFMMNSLVGNFAATSAPLNVIIDREGVICMLEGGSKAGSVFNSIFKKYSTAPYYTGEEQNTVSFGSYEAILPEKHD